jgi:hypothetical protein
VDSFQLSKWESLRGFLFLLSIVRPDIPSLHVLPIRLIGFLLMMTCRVSWMRSWIIAPKHDRCESSAKVYSKLWLASASSSLHTRNGNKRRSPFIFRKGAATGYRHQRPLPESVMFTYSPIPMTPDPTRVMRRPDVLAFRNPKRRMATMRIARPTYHHVVNVARIAIAILQSPQHPTLIHVRSVPINSHATAMRHSTPRHSLR